MIYSNRIIRFQEADNPESSGDYTDRRDIDIEEIESRNSETHVVTVLCSNMVILCPNISLY